MRKTRTRKSYKGGFLGFEDNTNSTYPNTTYPTTSNTGLENVMDSVKKMYNSARQSVSNAYNNMTNPTSTTYTQPSSIYTNPNEKKWYDISGWFSGGKRSRRRSSKLRGKKGGAPVGYPDLSLATNVSGIKVAEPTYWIKGGKRTRSRRNKHSRRHHRK